MQGALTSCSEDITEIFCILTAEQPRYTMINAIDLLFAFSGYERYNGVKLDG